MSRKKIEALVQAQLQSEGAKKSKNLRKVDSIIRTLEE